MRSEALSDEPAERLGKEMTPGPGRTDVLGTVAIGVSTTLGSIVSARPRLKGEPFGLQVPGTVVGHLIAGLGAGLAAPWPMTLLALRWPRPVGLTLLMGTLVEPVTWGRRARSADVGLAVAANLAAVAVLCRQRRATDRR